MHLGDLGAAKGALEPDTFTWFGVDVRTNPDITDLVLADFLEVAAAVDVDDPSSAAAAMAVVKGFLRSLVHPDDFAAFWATALRERQSLTDVLSVGRAIIEAVTSRPTVRPSVSTDGPSTTPTSSPSNMASIAESAHPGRPDLQVAALRAVV
jgi:hypothetical protein